MDSFFSELSLHEANAIVRIHRAGVGSITLVTQEAPSGLERATALAIPFSIVQDAPARCLPREGGTDPV